MAEYCMDLVVEPPSLHSHVNVYPTFGMLCMLDDSCVELLVEPPSLHSHVNGYPTFGMLCMLDDSVMELLVEPLVHPIIAV